MTEQKMNGGTIMNDCGAFGLSLGALIVAAPAAVSSSQSSVPVLALSLS